MKLVHEYKGDKIDEYPNHLVDIKWNASVRNKHKL